MDLKPRGNPSAPVWVIVEKPYPKDEKITFDSGYGYVFHEMMKEAGLHDYYILPRFSDLSDLNCATEVFSHINHYKPPIIIPLEQSGRQFCKELNPFRVTKSKKGVPVSQSFLDAQSDIEKYAGSLLKSDKIKYDHWVVPTFAPHTISSHWEQRDIVTSIDLGKVRDELEYFRLHGSLQPYKTRRLISDNIPFDEILGYLDRFKHSRLLSNDIETIYIKGNDKKSIFIGHPGYPITVGLADSDSFGISISLFRDSVRETVKLWQELQWLFLNVPTLGQNFLIFDIHLYHMLGFELPAENVEDTLFRQHILWPELPKSLQFMTRQYTRQPFYKDEGKRWSMKQLKSLKHYNCLDVTVTFEVYQGQEEENKQRPHLR